MPPDAGAPTVDVVVADGIGTITLVRSTKRNAINAQMAQEFSTGVDQMVDSGVRVAVLRSVGPVFCAGADLRELVTAEESIATIVGAMTEHPIHWTVRVTAPVIGAGLSLLAAANRVIATPGATFQMPELQRGFFPKALMRDQVPVMGLRPAFSMAFDASPYDATTAQRLGIVDDVVAENAIDAVLAEQSTRLASFDPNALAAGIRLWQDAVQRQVFGHLPKAMSDGAQRN
jgi:enoyl-CoA hydratase/carnithine racemase